MADRAVAVTAQQIHDSRPQEREHRCIGAIGVAVGVLSKLGVTGPVPFVFDAPALADQTQQGVWRGADARLEQRTSCCGAAAARGGGDNLDNPAAAWPVRLDVLRRLLG